MDSIVGIQIINIYIYLYSTGRLFASRSGYATQYIKLAAASGFGGVRGAARSPVDHGLAKRGRPCLPRSWPAGMAWLGIREQRIAIAIAGL